MLYCASCTPSVMVEVGNFAAFCASELTVPITDLSVSLINQGPVHLAWLPLSSSAWPGQTSCQCHACFFVGGGKGKCCKTGAVVTSQSTVFCGQQLCSHGRLYRVWPSALTHCYTLTAWTWEYQPSTCMCSPGQGDTVTAASLLHHSVSSHSQRHCTLDDTGRSY